MNKVYCIIAIFITMLFYLTMPVYADGMGVKALMNSHLELQMENSQAAAINFRDGIQRMLITVDFGEDNIDEMIWIFPVPSKPENIKIDLSDQFPEINAHDPVPIAKKTIGNLLTIMRYSQIYPFVAGAALGSFFPGKEIIGHLSSGSDFKVHSSISKMGITSELIEVKNSDALFNYIKNKKLIIDKKHLSAFNDYGNNYSFVATWISSRKEFNRNFPVNMSDNKKSNTKPTLYVKFPAGKPYFPLKPTSVYGKTEIPIKLYLYGSFVPDTYEEIKLSTKTSHQLYRDLKKAGVEDFYTGLEPDGIITTVEIFTYSDNFKKDLWFFKNNSVKFQLDYALFWEQLNDNPVSYGIIFMLILAVFSLVSSGIAGMVTFNEGVKYSVLGLFNLLSLGGLALALVFIKITPEEFLIKYPDLYLRFLGVFTIVFVVLTYLLQFILMIPLWMKF